MKQIERDLREKIYCNISMALQGPVVEIKGFDDAVKAIERVRSREVCENCSDYHPKILITNRPNLGEYFMYNHCAAGCETILKPKRQSCLEFKARGENAQN